MNPEAVDYFTFEGAPGRYFRCERYGVMRDEACARAWMAAPEASRGGRLAGCVGCEIGRRHAGMPAPEKVHAAPSLVCVRCRRSSADGKGGGFGSVGRVRFVRGLICVSCFNREREVIKGRDAKGNRPGLVLLPLEVATVDGQRRRAVARVPLARDRVEVALTALRGGAAMVGWAAPGVIDEEAGSQG